MPVKATLRPSGDHAGLKIAGTPLIPISSILFSRVTSTIAILLAPFVKTTNANFRLSGDHVPDDSMKLKSSISAFLTTLDSFLIILPVEASARKRSSVKRFLSEKNAMYFPSGLTEGEILILPPFNLEIIILPVSVSVLFSR